MDRSANRPRATTSPATKGTRKRHRHRDWRALGPKVLFKKKGKCRKATTEPNSSSGSGRTLRGLAHLGEVLPYPWGCTLFGAVFAARLRPQPPQVLLDRGHAPGERVHQGLPALLELPYLRVGRVGALVHLSPELREQLPPVGRPLPDDILAGRGGLLAALSEVL